jgi:hypothetical protein
LDYIQFSASFQKKYAALVLPADCAEVLPATFKVSSSLVWTLDWCLQFADKRHLRIREHYARHTSMIGMSRRHSFAYHYGPTTVTGPDGLPVRDSAGPVDIRIDNSNMPAHLHYGAPQPHHPQSAIKGLDMENIDAFTFIRAIFKHRTTGKPIADTLGFRIE